MVKNGAPSPAILVQAAMGLRAACIRTAGLGALFFTIYRNLANRSRGPNRSLSLLVAAGKDTKKIEAFIYSSSLSFASRTKACEKKLQAWSLLARIRYLVEINCNLLGMFKVRIFLATTILGNILHS